MILTYFHIYFNGYISTISINSFKFEPQMELALIVILIPFMVLYVYEATKPEKIIYSSNQDNNNDEAISNMS